MSDDRKETLQAKKKELEAELKGLQDELDDSLDEVKSEVKSSLDPLEHVRRNPIPAVAISVLVGFLIGREGHEESSGSSESVDAPGEKLSSTLSYELKRLVTRKGISFISDYLEGMLRK